MRNEEGKLFATAISLALFLLFLLASCAPEKPPLEPIYATVEIQIPCTDPLHIHVVEGPATEGPVLAANPPCGSPAEAFDAQGTEITLFGSGFYPTTETSLIWDDGYGEFRHRQAGEYITPTTDQEGEFSISILMQDRLIPADIGEDYQVWNLTALQGEPEEEAEPLQWESVVEHLYISIVGGIMGIVAGVFVGLFLAKALHSLVKSKPSLRLVGFFFPSRSMLVSVLMFLVFPVWLIIEFGFGATAGIIGTSIAALILAASITSTLLLWKWQRASLMFQLASALRTLLVLSVLITTWLGYHALGGVTWIAVMHVRLFEYDVALRYYLLIVLMLLIFDLLGGVVAFLLNSREERSSAISEAEG